MKKGLPTREAFSASNTHDPTLGPLAPPAELTTHDTRGSAQRILEELAFFEEEPSTTCNNGSCAGDPNDNHVGVDTNGSLDRSLSPSPMA